MDDLEKIVSGFLAEHGLAGEELLLGFSGGGDSTALFLMLNRIGQRFRAVHFEHGIRGRESLEEAEWCRGFSERHGVPFECHSLAVPAHRRAGEGIEAAARRLRLRRWQEIALEEDRAVLLAHHRDDCLENFLLRLGRGAGGSGLSGLRPFRRIGGLRVYRPMLAIRRSRLEKYLGGLGIGDWCLDSSNEDTAYRRNAVRHELLPLWRGIFGGDENLARSLEILTGEARYLEEQAALQASALKDIDSWKAVPSALLPRVLRFWWRERTGQDRVFNRNDFLGLGRALERFSGGRRRLEFSGGGSAVISKGGLEIYRRWPVVRTRTWRWRKCPRLEMPEIGRALEILPEQAEPPEESEAFDAEALGETLQVRAWRKGDRIRPFGSVFHKKIQDLWTEAGIPAERRPSVPFVLKGGEVVWIPGVRRAEFGRVGDGRPAVRIALAPAGGSAAEKT